MTRSARPTPPPVVEGSPAILDLLTFNPEDGRIWLNDKRMMLFDVSAFQALRTLIVDTLGRPAARRHFARIGFASGKRDAEIVRAQWPADQHVALGPHFHSVAGVVQSVLVNTRRNPAGKFEEGEWVWHHSVEADADINAYGLGTHAACWMQTGYATGFVSTLIGVPTIFREFACRAMGGTCCRVVARDAARWDDPEEFDYLDLDRGASSRPPRRDGGVLHVAVETAARKEACEPLIIGSSPALRSALAQTRAVAVTRASVLVTGESGVGKELFARSIHDLSDRSDRPFVAVNCAAIPEGLVEADLFGVEKGAFTGAVASREGRFERADGGTLFLDEIGTLSLVAQAKLLRAIQEGEVERVGGVRSRRVDIRLIAATNSDLRAEVSAGRFREDLYFRLNVFPINLPPLRERREDISPLVFHFIAEFNAAYGKRISRLSAAAMRLLLNYRFPGNVRECRNLVERAVIMAEGEEIDVAHLFSEGAPVHSPLFSVNGEGRLAARNPAGSPDVGPERVAEALLADAWGERGLSLDDLEAALRERAVREAMERSGRNVAEAARLLGIRRHRLEYLLKRA